MESLTNLIEKLKAVDAELEGVRERMNALAVKCDKLEKENARLRDNGRIESYVQTLRAVTQLAVDVGIPDAESTGHDTLVVQLREKYIARLGQVAANQEAADVLRLIEAGPMTITPLAGGPLLWSVSCDRKGLGAGGFTSLSRCVRDVAKRNGITLPAKDGDQVPDAGKMVSPVTSPNSDSPDVVSGAEGEGAKFTLAYCDPDDKWRLFYPSGGMLGDVPNMDMGEGEERAREWLAYLNGTSPVHEQLAEARAETESLRRCREAWDAVRRNQMRIGTGGRTASEPAQFVAMSFSGSVAKESHDPIEAVLELAKTLEAGAAGQTKKRTEF